MSERLYTIVCADDVTKILMVMSVRRITIDWYFLGVVVLAASNPYSIQSLGKGSENLLLGNAYMCVWIYENRAYFNTTTLTLLRENTPVFSLNQPQAFCQHTPY